MKPVDEELERLLELLRDPLREPLVRRPSSLASFQKPVICLPDKSSETPEGKKL